MAAEAAAADIGGSGLRAARAGPGGIAGPVVRRPLRRETGLDELLATLAAAVGPAPDVLAVAIPSFLLPDGTVVDCPTLPSLQGVALAAAIAAATGAGDVLVLPDLAAAATGEYRLGTGRGVGRFLCVALGTGANAAAIVDGALVETAFGCLGDAGHVIVEPDGPPCACGGRGCLEAVASGWALGGDGRAVAERASSGDEAARALLERAGVGLGRAIASWSALLWPERVAVGGGVAGAGDLLLEPARRELHRVGAPYIVDRIEVVPALLGGEATLAGAALFAYDTWRAR